ncbi:uncharacterized protein LOC119605248 [Lucilia sericata]|uniref:uncharacterized protein LOC119605248 n=1 Tax=Lucilia sericata TaxID=13632 RepID=UPI0018A86777|nr:uncharacterized protein LOC119605248 [Lucilia sericata]
MEEENKEENVETKVTSLQSSLNVMCAICSEFFKSTDIIYSTSKCGHVFHRQCLFRWLTRSNTCPQCRASVHQHNVHRLFLNFSEPTAMDEIDAEPIKSFEWLYVDESITAEEIAQFGFILGLDKESDPLFAARVYLEDDLLPAYYVPKLKGAYAAWNCESHFLTEGIELLHINNDNADYKWLPSSNGEIPTNALASGYAETGETLYTARYVHNDRMRYGKLHPSHGCAYIPYKGKELNNRNYEVLVRIPKDSV